MACSGDEETKENDADKVTSVETIEATEGDLVIEKSIYGRAQPGSTKPIMVENPGEIDSLEVGNGDKVDKDDVIGTIKSPAGKQTLYAPKAGEVVHLEADEGDIVSNEEPLAIIADMDTMKLKFTVTADVQKLLKKEEKHKAIINNKEYEAEITSIDMMPDDTGLYPVEATIENDKTAILPGMTAMIQIPEKRVKKAIILPTEAIIEESDETFIYIVKDDQAVKTEIDIKETQSDKTAIEGEVKKGDQVVVNGQLTLSDGYKVDVVKESGE